MKKSLTCTAAALFALALIAGCGDGEKPKTDDGGAKPKVSSVHIHLCEKCGQIEGGDKCCDESATKCEKCGMIAGSPACCNEKILTMLKDGDHFDVCSKCGHAKLDGKCHCGDANAEKCAACGHHKGSLLCVAECGKPESSEKKEPVPAPDPKKNEKETGG